jgi:uncharacterized membrane protein YfcA
MDPFAFLNAQFAAALGGPPTSVHLAVLIGAFLLGGLVKGLIGVGLPLVVVPLLAFVMPSPKAIALMAIPVLTSNVWQAARSGHVRSTLRRFTPLLVPLAIMTAITVRLSLAMPVALLNNLLAMTLLVAVALMTWQPTLDLAPARERWWSTITGALAGVMGGVSSVTGPLLITYLVALRLPREAFIGAISVLYFATAAPLFGSMMLLGVIGLPELTLSAMAMAPMFFGMVVGTRLRPRIGEATFRRLLLGFLVVVAVLLLAR